MTGADDLICYWDGGRQYADIPASSTFGVTFSSVFWLVISPSVAAMSPAARFPSCHEAGSLVVHVSKLGVALPKKTCYAVDLSKP